VSNPTDTRIPPTGGSGTAPPRGGTPTVSEALAVWCELTAQLRAEIDRLTTLHRAEQEHNRRLSAACSLYRPGLEIGRTALAEADEQDRFDVDATDMLNLLDRADDLAIPTATEVPT
jgi:hypothetical protein